MMHASSGGGAHTGPTAFFVNTPFGTAWNTNATDPSSMEAAV